MTDRIARGKAARAEVPRAAHAAFERTGKIDPLALLDRQARTRVPELVPIRYGRMVVSPFWGWRRDTAGLGGGSRDLYVRQLKDWKGSAGIDQLTPAGLVA